MRAARTPVPEVSHLALPCADCAHLGGGRPLPGRTWGAWRGAFSCRPVVDTRGRRECRTQALAFGGMFCRTGGCRVPSAGLGAGRMRQAAGGRGRAADPQAPQGAALPAHACRMALGRRTRARAAILPGGHGHAACAGARRLAAPFRLVLGVAHGPLACMPGGTASAAVAWAMRRRAGLDRFSAAAAWACMRPSVNFRPRVWTAHARAGACGGHVPSCRAREDALRRICGPLSPPLQRLGHGADRAGLGIYPTCHIRPPAPRRRERHKAGAGGGGARRQGGSEPAGRLGSEP